MPSQHSLGCTPCPGWHCPTKTVSERGRAGSVWEGEATARVWCGGVAACLHIRVMLRARALVCDQRFPRRQESNGSTEEEWDWRKNETGGFGAKSGWRERL